MFSVKLAESKIKDLQSANGVIIIAVYVQGDESGARFLLTYSTPSDSFVADYARLDEDAISDFLSNTRHDLRPVLRSTIRKAMNVER
jgi:hypothetical protein